MGEAGDKSNASPTTTAPCLTAGAQVANLDTITFARYSSFAADRSIIVDAISTTPMTSQRT